MLNYSLFKELLSLFGEDISNFISTIERSIVIFFSFISSAIENNFINELSFILEYVKKNNVKRILKNCKEDIIYIINESQKDDVDVSNIILKAKKIISFLTDREFNSIKSICASRYSLDFKSLVDSLYTSRNIFSDCINYFFDEKVLEEIDNVLNDIKKFNDSMDFALDIAWPLTSLSFLWSNGPAKYSIFLLVSNLINGPNFNSTDNIFGDILKTTLSTVLGVVNIVLSPLYGVTELIVYCNQNNITFWEWANAHWECIKDNWILALDPLNVFHSCIRNLVKLK